MVLPVTKNNRRTGWRSHAALSFEVISLQLQISLNVKTSKNEAFETLKHERIESQAVFMSHWFDL